MRQDRITTFELTGESCGCCSAVGVVKETVFVYRNLKPLVFFEYNGYKERVGSFRIKLDTRYIESFLASWRESLQNFKMTMQSVSAMAAYVRFECGIPLIRQQKSVERLCIRHMGRKLKDI